MLAKIAHIIKHYQLPIISGLLIGTSYIPFPAWASWFCLIPIFRFWFEKDRSFKEIFIGGWITGFVLTLIGFNWVIFVAHEFGHFPWPMAFVVLLLYCALTNLDFAITGLIWGLIQKKWKPPPAISMAIMVLIFALAEAYTPTIFPWNYGYTLYWTGLPMYQLAELIGFQGLSTLIIFINLALWRSLYVDDKSIKRKLWGLVALAVMFLNFAGWGLKQSLPEPDKEKTFLITQANIGNLQKQMAEQGFGYRNHIIGKYMKLTEQGLKQKVDYVVWPETAFPARIHFDYDFSRYVEHLQNYVSDRGITLLTGAYGQYAHSPKVTNSLVVVEPSGKVRRDPYAKTKLLVFGEYIPFSEQFPILKKWIPAGDFYHGNGPKIEKFDDLSIGPQICYESLFPQFSIALANLGAEMIVNLTNDSWYGTWQEPYQHLYMTLARGVELRRPVIRSTNTGISTVSLANGDILEKSPMHVEWAGVYRVPYVQNPQKTLYQKYPWLTDALVLVLLSLLIGRLAFVRTK